MGDGKPRWRRRGKDEIYLLGDDEKNVSVVTLQVNGGARARYAAFVGGARVGIRRTVEEAKALAMEKRGEPMAVGGARKGAGRPPCSPKGARKMTFRLGDSHREELRLLAEEKGLTQTEVVRQFLEKAADRRKKKARAASA